MGKPTINKTMTLKDRVSGTLKHINGGTVKYKKNLRGLKVDAGKAWKAVKVGAAAAAATVAATGAALAAAATKTAQYGDEVDKTSQRVGLSRQSFQEWRHVLDQTGVSMSAFERATKNSHKAMMQASQGNEAAANAFHKIGVNIRDSNNELKSQEQIFEDTIYALSQYEDSAERTAVAQRLLGENAGREFASLINEGAHSVKEMREEAHKLGIVLSDDAIDNSVKFTDELDKLKKVGQGVFRELGAKALPHFTRGIEWIMEQTPKLRQFAVNAFNAIREAVDRNAERFDRIRSAVADIRDRFVSAFSPEGEGGSAVAWMMDVGIPAVVDGVAKVLETATGVYEYVSEHWSKIEPLVYGIVGGLVAYKVAMMGVTAWKHAATAAQWLWNAALNANPLGLIVLGIGAVIAAGTLLIRNLDNVKLAGQIAWNGILSGAEWMVNGVIKAINYMADNALRPINAIIEGVNKITGSSIKTVQLGVSAVDFATAKYDTSDQEFDWRWKKDPGESGLDGVMAELDAQQKKYEMELKQQSTSQGQLITALEDNTDMLHSTRGGGNTFNITVNASDLTAEEIADKLVPRIERKLFA